MINLKSHGFNTFAANRIGEIHQGTKPEEWYWLSGKLNISDLITRGCDIEQIIKDKTWQDGPSFLKLDFEKWPVKQQTDVSDIPELKAKTHAVQ